jgi:hypothetical protein
MGAVSGLGGVLLLPPLFVTGPRPPRRTATWRSWRRWPSCRCSSATCSSGAGLSVVSASTATTLSLIEPAVAPAIAVLVLHETLPALGWVGVAILLASLVLLTADSRRQHQDTPERIVVGTVARGRTRPIAHPQGHPAFLGLLRVLSPLSRRVTEMVGEWVGRLPRR